jgi:hypothetical protein
MKKEPTTTNVPESLKKAVTLYLLARANAVSLVVALPDFKTPELKGGE